MTEYGGFWLRVVAYIIDAIIVNMASYIVGLILGFVIGVGLAGGSSESEIVAIAELGGGLAGLVMGWLYYAVMESSAMQATLGKKVFGMVVTDEQGYRIGFGRATGRYFAKLLSMLILLIGFFMVGWTQRKQGLHDMLAGTLVVRNGGEAALAAQAKVFE